MTDPETGPAADEDFLLEYHGGFWRRHARAVVLAALIVLMVGGATAWEFAAADSSPAASGLAASPAPTSAFTTPTPTATSTPTHAPRPTPSPTPTPTATSSKSRDARVRIPNVVGAPVLVASEAITGAGLTVRLGTMRTTAHLAGTVVTESPQAGRLEPRGTSVRIFVAAAPPLVKVPDFFKSTLRKAELTLTELGLPYTAVATTGSPVGYDEVVAQSVVAGTGVRAGTRVTLTYVPNVP